MKPGDISLLRFDYAPGEYRVFIQKGEAIPMKKELKGTYAKVKFKDHVRVVLDKIIKNGIAHHISVVYGNLITPIEIFAKIMDWELIY
jgi:L-fucose isomerase-like protein